VKVVCILRINVKLIALGDNKEGQTRIIKAFFEENK
jgi:hypothetical protein